MSNIKYSVIIPTYNRSRFLLNALNSIVKQTIPSDQYEIIVIDDGSTDDTEQTVASYKRQVARPEIRYFKITKSSHVIAKNFGIRQSRGEILFFTDDDCIVPENWIEMLAESYKKYPDIAGSGGWYIPPKNEDRFFQKTGHLLDRLYNFPHYNSEFKIIDTFPTCVALIPNASYKKIIFEEIGGFDETTSYIEDVELKYRTRFIYNKNIAYVPVNVEHRCTNNFWRYAKKIVYQGMAKQYCNYKYFNNKPPLMFDVSFRRAPKKLFWTFSNILKTKKARKSDLPAIFVYLFLEVFLNTIGGFYEKYFGR